MVFIDQVVIVKSKKIEERKIVEKIQKKLLFHNNKKYNNRKRAKDWRMGQMNNMERKHSLPKAGFGLGQSQAHFNGVSDIC